MREPQPTPPRSITLRIDRKALTGNMATRSANGRQYKPTEYNAWMSYVYSLALRESERLRWTFPDYCISYVTLYNSQCDRDNGVKVLNDAVQGVFYASDRHIVDGPIRRVKDFGGKRIEVTVIALTEAQWRLYRQEKKRDPPPLSHERWVSLQFEGLFGDYSPAE